MSSNHSLFKFKIFWQIFRSAQGLILITSIIYLSGLTVNCFSLSQLQDYEQLVDFSKLSGMISYCACFLLPISISSLLFDFLFSKKKCDLIFSSPLQRKSIFWTNYWGGLLIILINLLLATMIVHFTVYNNTTFVVASDSALRYFAVWGSGMFLVYSASCLALSLTGNRFVHIILCCCILLLPGWFKNTYQMNYHNTDNTSRILPSDQLSNPLSISFPKETSLTMDTIPFVAFTETFYSDLRYTNYYFPTNYSYSRCLITLFPGILYCVLAMFAFVKRKTEVAETSFINEIFHESVRIATFLPLFYTLGTKDWLSASIYGAVLFILYSLYDVISRREVIVMKRTVLSFAVMLLLATLFRYPVRFLAKQESSRQLSRQDVTAISLIPVNSMMPGSQARQQLLNLRLDDPDLIDLIFKSQTNDVQSQQGAMFYVRFYEKKQSADFTLYITDENLDALIAHLEKNQTFQATVRNLQVDQVKQMTLLGNEVKFEPAQNTQLLNQIQKEVMKQDLAFLLKQTRQIKAIDGYENSYYLSLDLNSFSNGQSSSQSLDLLTYQSVFQLFAKNLNQQFLDYYSTMPIYLDYYSFNGTELDEIRQTTNMDYQQFNKVLSEYIIEIIPTSFQADEMSNASQFLYLNVYDNQRNKQSSIILRKDESWFNFLTNISKLQ